MTIDEARRSAAEEEMFCKIHYRKEEEKRKAAEDKEFERAGERIKEKRETERRKKIREIQERLNKEVPSRTVPPPRGVVRPGERHFEKEEEELSDRAETSGMSRRTFLRKAAIGTAVGFLGVKGLINLFSGKDEDEGEGPRFEVGKHDREWLLERVRETGEFISPEHRTVLNTEVMDALKDYWKGVYMGEKDKWDENGREIRYDIPGAYGRMLKYDDVIRGEFKKWEVPPDLRFLSIVESHWNNFGKRYSLKTAGGPFQFMASTAKWLGLKIDPSTGVGIDERFIPERSAWAAAKYLKWMMKGNGNDPNLALHEYNGGFALRYRRRVEREGGEPTYEEFLEHMAAGINKRKRDVLRFKEGEKAFWKDLKEGWEGGVLGNYKENIEYTAKVRAVIELVNDPEWKWKNGVA